MFTLPSSINMAVNVAASTRFPSEILGEGNYVRWRFIMENTLVRRDLIQVIQFDSPARGVNLNVWMDMDRTASELLLHSCEEGCFRDLVRSSKSAREAWNTLEKIHTSRSNNSDLPTLGRLDASRLLTDIEKGNVDAVKNFFATHQDAVKAREPINGYTALHVATICGRLNIVKALVELMSIQDTEIKNFANNTAVSLAVCNGMMEIVKSLVQKNPNFLTITDECGYIPLVEACLAADKDMAHYLYSVTPFEILLPQNGIQGSYFLCACMHKKRFDIALDALHRHPEMMIYEHDVLPLGALAQTPSAFFNASELGFWERWIYYCVNVEGPYGDSPIDVNGEGEDDDKSKLYKLRSTLLQFIVGIEQIQQIRDLKLTHAYALRTLHFMCEKMSTFDEVSYQKKRAFNEGQFRSEGAAGACFEAVKNGTLDFVREMAVTNPDVILIRSNENMRNILMTAIEYRQGEIAHFLHGLPTAKTLVNMVDAERNTVLHIVGKLAPAFQLNRISGAALQMQSEVHWYKEVESIVSQNLKEFKNYFQETPHQVFTREHSDLLSRAEKWTKDIARSCTVVGTLIVTIMFTAAFTIPGGNNQNTGFPMFSKEASFMVYIISVAISLFSASASILIFLDLQTSRYNMEDFHIKVPTKLIIGLSTLFISIAAMMEAFCLGIFLTLQRKWGVIIPTILLASISITLFVWLQFPSLVEIYVLTYKSPIFGEKRSLASKIRAYFTRRKIE